MQGTGAGYVRCTCVALECRAVRPQVVDEWIAMRAVLQLTQGCAVERQGNAALHAMPMEPVRGTDCIATCHAGRWRQLSLQQLWAHLSMLRLRSAFCAHLMLMRQGLRAVALRRRPPASAPVMAPRRAMPRGRPSIRAAAHGAEVHKRSAPLPPACTLPLPIAT
jgi:hypothetical protein